MSRRLAATASVVTVWLVAIIGFASPASAHSVSGVGATNWQTTLTSLSPAPAGLTVKVVENGSRLELTNRRPRDRRVRL